MSAQPTIQLARVTCPLRAALRTSRGEIHARQVALVRVRHGELWGYGSASPLPGFSPESFEDAWRQLERVQRGVTPDTLDALAQVQRPDQLQALLASLGADALCASARFALEVALLDLCAKRQGLPLGRWLRPEGASMSVPVNATITASSAAQCFIEVTRAVEQGFGCVKLKIGAASAALDLERARAARAALGERGLLRLDANGAFSEPEAVERLLALKPLGLELVEQPVPADALDALGRVARRVGVPVGADEAARSAQDIAQIIAQAAAQVIVIKPALIGSVLEAARMIEAAQAAGLDVIVTTILEDAVGRAAAAHLSAAFALERACGLATGELLVSDVTWTQDTLRAGRLELPALAGLGKTPDRVPEDAWTPAWTTAQRPAWPAATPTWHGLEAAPILIPHPLLHRAAWRPEQPAIYEEDGHTIRFGQLAELALDMASGLLERGVGPGDRVAVGAAPSVEACALLHAISALGAVLVALHERLPLQEQRELAARARAKLTIIEPAPAPALSRELAARGQLARQRPEGQAALAAALRREVALHEPLALLFTSGSTGEPKMPLLTWQSVVMSATGSAIQLGHLPDDVWLHALPLGHVAGLSILWRSALLGVAARLMPRYDAAKVAQAMAQGECTQVSLVSRMLWQVLDALGERRPHPRFRFVLLGGGAIPEALLERCHAQGVPVAPTFGMSEGASQLLTQPPTLDARGLGAGWPLIFTQARVMPDQALQVRGATLMAGYARADERDPQGLRLEPTPSWFDTGDLACEPERPGQPIRLEDRRQDRIVRGGENISPAQVEDVIRQLPGVREVCVLGVPDAQWGQRVVAIVAARETLDNQAILEHCRARLARFKTPEQVLRVDALPRGATEKLDRRALLALAIDAQGPALAPQDQPAPPAAERMDT